MSPQLSHRQLNRAMLDRQGLLSPFTGTVEDALRRLAGLQAQHSVSPYVALWPRRAEHSITELEQAVQARTAVKAPLMRGTLHVVAAEDYAALDVASAVPHLATWRPSARRAGLDLEELNAQVREFCAEPRTVADIEAHFARRYPDVDAQASIPAGVRNPWFQLATAGGGLLHVPPSGLWREHGKPTYLDAARWLGDLDRPTAEHALEHALLRFLRAYGPASVEDFMKWAGVNRKTPANNAVAALADQLVRHTGPGGRALLDVVGVAVPDDVAAPPRFLARWDSLLIAYRVRDRILPDRHVPAVVKKNGDFLPTFLLAGQVAGLWSVSEKAGRAQITLQPFAKVSKPDRTSLEEQAEQLVRFIAADATAHEVQWEAP